MKKPISKRQTENRKKPVRKKLGDAESGVIMLEAVFCMLVAIFVVFFFLAFGFYLYQRVMFTTAANEIAEEVVQTYKLRDVTDSEDVSSDDVEGVGKYRYLLFSYSFNSAAEAKAQTLATVRLQKTSFAQTGGAVSTEVETVVDDIGRRHYEVTVTQNYGFMLDGLLSMIGIEGQEALSTTVYVDSFDALNYVNTVKMGKYLSSQLEDEAVLGLVDSVISLIDKVIDLASSGS